MRETFKVVIRKMHVHQNVLTFVKSRQRDSHWSWATARLLEQSNPSGVPKSIYFLKHCKERQWQNTHIFFKFLNHLKPTWDFLFLFITTLCMKLPWFWHTNSGQLFCYCPLSRPLFWRETSRDVFSFCCCFKIAKNLVTDYFALQDGNTTTSTQTQIIKSLEVNVWTIMSSPLLLNQVFDWRKISTEWEKVGSLLYPIRPKSLKVGSCKV